MRPLIGITMSFDDNKKRAKISEKYYNAVELAGGLPLAIPLLRNKANLKTLAKKLDGVILTGGPDIDPSYFHEPPHPRLGKICPVRDGFETIITSEIIRLSKPLLGICRGMQVMNVVMGGTLYQDIDSQIKQPLNHMQKKSRGCKSHEIEIIEKDCLIYKITGQKRLKVNSFHHQSVKTPATNFKITAIAPDGVIEAIESRHGGAFCIGVQWHPEELTDDPPQMELFKYMVESCKK